MRSKKNYDSVYLKTLLNSLEVNRKLFCNYIKEYANKKNLSLTNETFIPKESEDSLLSYLDEVLNESVEDLKKVERIANGPCGTTIGNDMMSPRDHWLNWRNDLALRMVVLKNLTRLDTLDLQRALFICLDSPYIKS